MSDEKPARLGRRLMVVRLAAIGSSVTALSAGPALAQRSDSDPNDPGGNGSHCAGAGT